MRRFNAKQLRQDMGRVFAEAHRDSVRLSHQSHPDLLMISFINIHSIHTNTDGSLMIHTRPLTIEVPEASNDADGEDSAA